MNVTVHAQYLRIAPRKVRVTIDLVRGKTVTAALDQLSVLPKAAAPIVRKLLQHAVAAAVERKLSKDRLIIKAITADGGPVLKRFRPRAFGRASMIKKRLTHLHLTLSEQPAKPPATASSTKKSSPSRIARPAGTSTL